MIPTLNILWKDWCWSWSSCILATWYEELTYWKRPWCWQRLRAGGKGGNRGWRLDGIADSMDMSFEQTLGGSEEQGSLACYSSWSHKESDMTYQLNNNNPTSRPMCQKIIGEGYRENHALGWDPVYRRKKVKGLFKDCWGYRRFCWSLTMGPRAIAKQFQETGSNTR